MKPFTRNPKDFWAGILYMTLGLSAILMAKDYGMGSALKMGPGYFPIFLGVVLTCIGAISFIRSFILSGEAVSGFAVKGLMMILVATLLTGFLIRSAGVAVALPLMVVITAAASIHFRWKPTLALAVGITIFCTLVFIKGLGIILPIFGSWYWI